MMGRSAAEPQPKRGTAILAVSVTGGTPVPQGRGQQRWPWAELAASALHHAQNVCQKNEILRYCNAVPHIAWCY